LRSGIFDALKRFGQSVDASLEDPARSDACSHGGAIGRKRSDTGKGMDAIYLPAGKTVEQIVRAAVTKALVEQGYAVVDEKVAAVRPGFSDTLDIEQFWTCSCPHYAAAQHRSSSAPMLILKSEALTGRKEVVIGARLL